MPLTLNPHWSKYRYSQIDLKTALKTGGEKQLNLKNILKNLKIHESTISMILGAIVIVVLGVIVANYFRNIERGRLAEGSPTATTQTGQPKVTPGEGPVTYTVLEGENLWEIAESQYGSGYNWVDIAEENELANPAALAVGQELTIPDVEPKEATVEDYTMEGRIEMDGVISGGTYTVQRGDNLWDIAVRAYGDGYQWVRIAEENELANPDLIHSGNVLSIPR
jgi:LysM repeat protein